jgi:radical SAM protein with 4Fe4S-binding SPASM domain
MKKNGNLEINNPQRHFHFQWHLTERCNLRCKHCYQDKELLKDEMDLDTVKDILYQYFAILKEWKLPRQRSLISFTGGEPFLRSDIFDIVEECFKNHQMSRYGFLSNGYFLTEENVALLAGLKVDYYQVSIEGVEKTNDYIRGKGAYKKAVEGLKRLVKAGISTTISMTVHKKNLKDVPAMISLARELNVNCLGLRRLVPFGRGKAMSKFILSPQQTKAFLGYAENVKKENQKLRITTGCEDSIGAMSMHHVPDGCLSGYHTITLMPNGHVYPCRRLPILVGNLREKSLKDIFQKSDTFDKIRNVNNINSECQSCPFFNECLGGAKCISYAYWGRLGGGDPQCWRRFDKLPGRNKEWNIPYKPETVVQYF